MTSKPGFSMPRNAVFDQKTAILTLLDQKKKQFNCFLLVFRPLEPKSITFIHKIMILVILAYFRPTLANWVQ